MANEELPISVIVPFSKSRSDFFYGYCEPSIRANNVKEIIVVDEEGSAPYKRNKGAEKATQPYLYFCDDDCILNKDCLSTMYEIIDADKKDRSFIYCDYQTIVTDAKAHPNVGNRNFVAKAQPFDFEKLKKGNYIDTMSLIRADRFLGFDEKIMRFQDWEMWIRMAKEGYEGIYYPGVLFMKFYMDEGITSSPKITDKEAVNVIRKKHNF